MKLSVGVFGSIIVFLVFTGFVSASLIGDEVLIEHQGPELGMVASGDTTTVETGDGDVVTLGIFSVNMEAGRLYVEFALGGNFTTNSFDGLVVSDLNDDGGIDYVLSNVRVQTNMVDWDESRITIGDDWVAFNWSGLRYESDTEFAADLEFEPNPVPKIYSFNADTVSGDAPLNVTFTCIGPDPLSFYSRYILSYGDGSSIESNTTGIFNHTYSDLGLYYAVCRLNDRGDTVAESDPIAINVSGLIIDSFTADPISGEVPLNVTFTCAGRGTADPNIYYTLSYGDGTASEYNTTGIFNHTYSDLGLYYAVCSMYDEDERSINSGPITINVIEPTSQTPQQMIGDLSGEVQEYIDTGSLTNAQGQRLIRYLNRALTRLNNDRPRLAEARLNQFIRTINRFVRRGVLTAAEGQVLIDAANEIIEAI